MKNKLKWKYYKATKNCANCTALSYWKSKAKEHAEFHNKKEIQRLNKIKKICGEIQNLCQT